MMVEEAGDFDLQVLGEKRLTEIFMMEPKKLRRPIRFARQDHKEKMAFAVLLSKKMPALSSRIAPELWADIEAEKELTAADFDAAAAAAERAAKATAASE